MNNYDASASFLFAAQSAAALVDVRATLSGHLRGRLYHWSGSTASRHLDPVVLRIFRDGVRLDIQPGHVFGFQPDTVLPIFSDVRHVGGERHEAGVRGAAAARDIMGKIFLHFAVRTYLQIADWPSSNRHHASITECAVEKLCNGWWNRLAMV